MPEIDREALADERWLIRCAVDGAMHPGPAPMFTQEAYDYIAAGLGLTETERYKLELTAEVLACTTMVNDYTTDIVPLILDSAFSCALTTLNEWYADELAREEGVARNHGHLGKAEEAMEIMAQRMRARVNAEVTEMIDGAPDALDGTADARGHHDAPGNATRHGTSRGGRAGRRDRRKRKRKEKKRARR